MNLLKRRSQMTTYLVIIGSEALLVGFLILSSPSMERNAFLFGLSLGRLAAGSGALVAGLLLSCVSLGLPRIHRFLSQILDRLIDLIAKPHIAAWSSSLLLFASLSSLAALILLLHPITADGSYALHIGVRRLLPLTGWLALLPLQTSILVIAAADPDQRSRLLGGGYLLSRIGVALLLTATALHYLVLWIQIPLLSRLPGWFWRADAKELQWSHMTVVLIFLLLYVSMRWLRKQAHVGWKCLAVLFVLSVMAHFYMGAVDGTGIEAVKQNYRASPLSRELEAACTAPGVGQTIRNYEVLYGSHFWYGTKPPGLAAVYTVLRDSVSALDQHFNSQNCFETLITYKVHVLPIIVSLSMVGLMVIARSLTTHPASVTAPLLAITAPNFMLMAILPDQAIFLPLFTLALTAVVLAERAQRPFPMIGAGIAGYMATFVSFSLLPLLAFVPAWLAFDSVLRAGEKAPAPAMFRKLTAYALGCFGAAAFLFLTLSYNPIDRLSNALQQHRDIKDFSLGVPQLVEYGLLNIVEFSVWIGLGVAILAGFRSIRAILGVFRGQISRMDAFQLAVTATFVAMLIFGQTRGEVGRIWMFLLPLFALSAADEAEKIMPQPALTAVLLLTLQILSTYFTFVFQDFV